MNDTNEVKIQDGEKRRDPVRDYIPQCDLCDCALLKDTEYFKPVSSLESRLPAHRLYSWSCQRHVARAGKPRWWKILEDIGCWRHFPSSRCFAVSSRRRAESLSIRKANSCVIEMRNVRSSPTDSSISCTHYISMPDAVALSAWPLRRAFLQQCCSI